MTDKMLVKLTIEVTVEERDSMVKLAHERGFETVDEYLRALAADDAEDDERSIEDIREGIKQGLREALRGEYLPLETLWANDTQQ